MSQPSEDSIPDFIAAVEIAFQRDREREAAGWVVVCVDDEDGQIVNASGVFSTPEAALIEAGLRHADGKKMLEPGEPDWTYVVVPMFEPTR